MQKGIIMNEKKFNAFPLSKTLDQNFWNDLYKSNSMGWDLGKVSPPIKTFIDTLQDKNTSILIPGCGNSYEAEYLLIEGFTNVTVIDIAPVLVENLKQKFESNDNIKVILGDFFEHQGKYDLIIEQTFFCALPPISRKQYVFKMHQLLIEGGKLAGLLFNKSFDAGPPFGGSKAEYEQLFSLSFDIVNMDFCLNSVKPRANSELFFEFLKK